jgi:hypothetical protein
MRSSCPFVPVSGHQPGKALTSWGNLQEGRRDIVKIHALGLLFVLLSTGLAQPQQSRPQRSTREDWRSYSPGNMALSLELPGEPRSQDIHLPGNTPEDKSFIYISKQLRWLVNINQSYLSQSVDLKKIATGYVEGITALCDSRSVRYSLEPSTYTYVPISGSYKQGREPWAFKGFITAKGNHIFLVACTWLVTNKAAQVAIQRVLDSVQFNADKIYAVEIRRH